MGTTGKRGIGILRDKSLYRSIAFTREEREELGLTGLLPYSVSSPGELVLRVMESLRRCRTDIDRYMLLASLQERNEQLFYRVTMDHIEEILPLIYTPTVGEACERYSHIAREPRGFFITPDDRGRIAAILENWPETDIRVIVVTDGQRILGLGDLGANGMAIPIGKLALYTACGGIPPAQCLPVLLDVGTNNPKLLDDVQYLGYPHPRIEGEEYVSLVDEFMDAVQERYPGALVQFEDFLTPNAYRLLGRYRDRALCFNDDIQGTAAVALAGVLASTRITHLEFADLKIMFLGAGSAATGIADLISAALVAEGLSQEDARRRLTFVDVDGLVVSGRESLMDHVRPYAQDRPALGFLDAIVAVQPDVLIGATGAPGTFTREVVQAMCGYAERPVIFALSNPTSRAECTPKQAYRWSDGRAVFASGSPFGEVTHAGEVFRPGQANNAYVFPGIGLGAVSCRARRVPDEFFLVAARTLAGMVAKEDLAYGALFPPLTALRDVSLEIAVGVAAVAGEMELAQVPVGEDRRQMISSAMYDPLAGPRGRH